MKKKEIKEKIFDLKSDEEIEQFVKNRIAELEKITEEKTAGQGYTTTFNDYISSKVNFKPVASSKDKECPNLVYDDILPYLELVKILADEKSYLTELYLFSPIAVEIDNYFSNNKAKACMLESLIERQAIYSSATNKNIENISIKEFYKKNCGFCSEKTGLAHNIFKILGVDSQYVLGKRNNQNHAFNIIFPHGYDVAPAVLFDTSFKLTFTNGLGKNYSCGVFKVLKQEEYENMLSGNNTLIDFEKSVNDLLIYYSLQNFNSNYKNAEYCIGIDSYSKNNNKTLCLKKQ